MASGMFRLSNTAACRERENGESIAESKHLITVGVGIQYSDYLGTYFLFVCEYRIQKCNIHYSASERGRYHRVAMFFEGTG
jgi:hypothetical protein